VACALGVVFALAAAAARLTWRSAGLLVGLAVFLDGAFLIAWADAGPRGPPPGAGIGRPPP
jgi:hypothetical protein